MQQWRHVFSSLVFQASSDSSQSEFSRRRISEFRRRRSRKKVVLVITMVAVLSMLASKLFAVSPRSIWMHSRSSSCFLVVFLPLSTALLA